MTDDLEIDEPLSVVSSSSKSDNERKGIKKFSGIVQLSSLFTGLTSSATLSDKETERQRLFEGSSTDTKPRMRTREEIIAKYRKAGVISSKNE